jgi:tRNA-2-methylthio-N6-dimethylallyladenosine synthase
MSSSPLPVVNHSGKVTYSAERPRYHIATWGCQMNVLDGERMAGQLKARGLAPAAEPGDADVIVLNTCHIRAKADHKVYSELGTLEGIRRDRPGLVIGVAGCLAQAEGEAIFERAPWVDFVLGPGQVEKLGETVERVRDERRRVAALELPQDSPVYQFRQIARSSPHQAYVTAIEGCDQYCTFCVVPFTRGRERSRGSSEILAELAHLAAQGYTEVTLLGQTVNAYRDPEEGFGLGRLLEEAARRTPGIRRLRFVTSHPRFVDEELLAALARGGPIAPYVHMPAQSGSDRLLYRMKRRYDARGYLQTVERLREAVPELAISSDFIVGFPGETEEDFEATLDLVRQVRFASLFGFIYSARRGTAAARWAGRSAVPEDVASARLKRLLALQTELQLELNQGLLGRVEEVLVEEAGRDGQASGRTSCNRIVNFPAGESAPAEGSYVRVRITRGLPNSLRGERIT